MLKIAVCDDETLHCKIAKENIIECMQILHTPCEIQTFQSGADLLNSGIEYDLLFMDIEFRNNAENGFQISTEYTRIFPHTRIILLTVHSERMSNGYKIHAFRFLTKPIQREALIETLANAMQEISQEPKILLRNEKGEICDIRMLDIIYAEAGTKSCCIRTIRGIYSYPNGITELRTQLNGLPFYQPYRTYLINLNHITSVGEFILMSTGEKIPLSRLKKKNSKRYKKISLGESFMVYDIFTQSIVFFLDFLKILLGFYFVLSFRLKLSWFKIFSTLCVIPTAVILLYDTFLYNRINGPFFIIFLYLPFGLLKNLI